MSDSRFSELRASWLRLQTGVQYGVQHGVQYGFLYGVQYGFLYGVQYGVLYGFSEKAQRVPHNMPANAARLS